MTEPDFNEQLTNEDIERICMIRRDVLRKIADVLDIIEARGFADAVIRAQDERLNIPYTLVQQAQILWQITT